MAVLSEGVEGLLFLPSDFFLSCLLLATLFWVYVHQKLSLCLPYYFLPASAWEVHTSKIALYRKQQREKAKQQEGAPVMGATPSSSAAAEPSHDTSAFPPEALAAAAAAAKTPKALRAYFVISRANATAFLHAALVCPMAVAVLYATMKKASEEQGASPDGPLWGASPTQGPLGALKWLIWDWAETDAFFNNRSFLLDFIAYLMGGYFLWDLVECVINRDVHSRAFVLHAVLSLYAMLAYLNTVNGKMTGISGFMCLSEISTPFIHVRWFLLQSGQTDSPLFSFFNVGAGAAFIFFRLGVIPFLVLPHLVLEWLRGSMYTAKAPLFRRVSFAVSCSLWVLLNTYWALLFARSHLKHRKAVHPRKEHKP